MGQLDQYGKRLLLVAAMFGVSAALATVTSVHAGRILTQPKQAVLQASPLAAVQTNSVSEPEPTESLDAQEGFFVVARTEPGRQVSVLQQGVCLQTVAANTKGDATFSGLLPGHYRLVSGIRGGDFWLWENASVTATCGVGRW